MTDHELIKAIELAMMVDEGLETNGGGFVIDRGLLWEVTARLADLQAENAEKDREIERLQDPCGFIELLHERAVRAEAERDAAINDMKLMADKIREEHGDSVPCFACRFDCDMSIMPSGDFANECPGFDREDCFEWRGAQGEGQGDNKVDAEK